ncbi:ABC transporter substrate-binding protein [Bordetella genomosp. 6]|uniref:ABC transporter substrate-binding protein n=1 Tax=Bordetella genomosp. 6 TaxID=463024 RepID=UPI000A296013|nr:extracellular solute-binding protein [Bordetella genomosp. 6]ARP75384.1 ABC transporter substrate-binding protein [Bordetella genomosp. 6]
MMKRVASLLVSSLLYSGCAMADGSIVVWMTDSRPGYKKWLETEAAAFKAKQPGVKVSVVQMSPNDAYLKIPAAAAAGGLPDVIWTTYGLAPWLDGMKGGKLADVSDLIDRLGKDRFDEDALKQWSYRGAVACVPVARTPTYLMYRADLFKKAGLAAPESWDDVIRAAQKLNDPANGKYGIAMPGKTDFSPRFAYGMILYSMGGSTFDAQGNPIFESAASIDALKVYKQLYAYSPPGSLNFGFSEIQRALAQGRVAMTISNPSSMATFQRTNRDEGSTLALALPGKVNRTIQNQRGWCIADGKNSQTAKAFVEHLFSTNSFAAYLEAASISSFPVYHDQAAYGQFQASNETVKRFPDATDFIRRHTDGTMPGIDGVGLTPKSGDLISSGQIESAINKMLANDMSEQETAAAMQKETLRLLN